LRHNGRPLSGTLKKTKQNKTKIQAHKIEMLKNTAEIARTRTWKARASACPVWL
jgi:hypothetical protein